MKRAPYLIMTFFALTIFNTHAATIIKCDEPQWVSPASIVNGVFKANLKGSCTISGALKGDIQELYQHYQDRQLDGVSIVHMEPSPDISLGLIGTMSDVTVKTAEGPIRNLVKIATDSKSKMIYSSISKLVQFSGFASLVKKLDIDFNVTHMKNGSFQINLVNLTLINKPVLIPSVTFLGPGSRESMKQFRASLTKLSQEISNVLK